ncbi:retrovirus-related pol polyprotein from transposon TNT 1-94, partial [Tanacetum coccineum]
QKNEKWRLAMDAEIEAIEKNDTWEMTDLPHGAKKVGVKWVYKTKYNENGEVEKYKARLVWPQGISSLRSTGGINNESGSGGSGDDGRGGSGDDGRGGSG